MEKKNNTEDILKNSVFEKQLLEKEVNQLNIKIRTSSQELGNVRKEYDMQSPQLKSSLHRSINSAYELQPRNRNAIKIDGVSRRKGSYNDIMQNLSRSFTTNKNAEW